jgi:hypothetical protein
MNFWDFKSNNDFWKRKKSEQYQAGIWPKDSRCWAGPQQNQPMRPMPADARGVVTATTSGAVVRLPAVSQPMRCSGGGGSSTGRTRGVHRAR